MTEEMITTTESRLLSFLAEIEAGSTNISASVRDLILLCIILTTNCFTESVGHHR